MFGPGDGPPTYERLFDVHAYGPRTAPYGPGPPVWPRYPAPAVDGPTAPYGPRTRPYTAPGRLPPARPAVAGTRPVASRYPAPAVASRPALGVRVPGPG